MKLFVKLKTIILLLFISTSISSFAVNDSLCSCLQYIAQVDKDDSICRAMVTDSIYDRVFARYDDVSTLKDTSLFLKMWHEEYDTLRNECAKIGYNMNASQNDDQESSGINNDDQESIWDKPAFIKIFGIILCVFMAGIIKEIIANKRKKLGHKLQKLINLAGRVPIDKIEDQLVDTFEISTYDGFWQNFSKGGDEDQMRLSIFNTNLSLNTNEKSAKIYFKDITLINYSTHSRGRYEAITDTYLELYFDDEKLVFSTSAENISANDKTMLANQLAKIRINKSNAKLLGQRTGIEFKTVLESTLTKLVDGTKED